MLHQIYNSTDGSVFNGSARKYYFAKFVLAILIILQLTTLSLFILSWSCVVMTFTHAFSNDDPFIRYVLNSRCLRYWLCTRWKKAFKLQINSLKQLVSGLVVFSLTLSRFIKQLDIFWLCSLVQLKATLRRVLMNEINTVLKHNVTFSQRSHSTLPLHWRPLSALPAKCLS